MPEILEEEFVEDPIEHEEDEGEKNDEDEPEAASLETIDHFGNLAGYIADQPGGEALLTTMGSELVDLVNADIRSRSKWEKVLAKGIKLMGVSEDRIAGAPFTGSSKAVHPVLLEAGVQFQARAITELWPAAGPVKSSIIGEPDDEGLLEAQRKRSQMFMNYQYTVDMPEAFWEMDQMLMRLPFEGSTFKKNYISPILGRPTTEYLTAQKLIVSDKATDLRTAPRVTHEYPLSKNNLLKMKVRGAFRNVDLPEPDDTAGEDSEIDEEIDRSEGRTNDEAGDLEPSDHTIFEVHTEWHIDVPGLMDTDANGKETGIAIPFVITIDRDSATVLSVVRNWEEDDDEVKEKIQSFVHYKYLPGFGFYGFGLLHAIGSLSEAATGSLRSLLDSAQFANMQGGFKSKDLKIEGGDITLAPGQWQDVNATLDDMSKGFFVPPYQEPSLVLYQLLGALVEYAQRFASTTEAMVGDASNTGPVGTTVALIEQGSKVFSAIHKRCHAAQGEEFRQIARLNQFYIPEGGMKFAYQDSGDTIRKEDFDGRIDIHPVSDPTIFSQTQRIAQAQAELQLAKSEPSLYHMDRVHRRMHEALNTSNVDEIMIDQDKAVQSMSPVHENMAMLGKKPIRAFLHQHHPAHLAAHESFFMSLPPEMQQVIGPAHMAHKAEHLAMAYFVNMGKVMAQKGIQMTPPKMHSKSGDEQFAQPLPPEMENAIAMEAANIAQQVGPGPGQKKEDPEQAKLKQKLAMNEQEHKQKLTQKEEDHKQDLAHEQEKHDQKLQLDDAAAANSMFAESRP